MNEHWTERLSDYMEGELSASERERIEAHLASCEPCARALEELREVVARARALTPSEPPRDLWPSIRAELAPRGEPAVIDLAAHRAAGEDEGRPRPFLRRRLSVTVSQLAAAGLALALATGWGAWLVRPEAPAGDAAARSSAFRTVSTEAGDPAVSSEVAELERVLAAGASRLDPNTLRIVEKNLGIIDRAIRESREALAQDPGNAFLEEHLRRSYDRKSAYLREAATLLEL